MTIIYRGTGALTALFAEPARALGKPDATSSLSLCGVRRTSAVLISAVLLAENSRVPSTSRHKLAPLAAARNCRDAGELPREDYSGAQTIAGALTANIHRVC